MKGLIHGFNVYAIIVLAGFAFFGGGLGLAAMNYRRWIGRNKAERR
jgi:hypothetical protein